MQESVKKAKLVESETRYLSLVGAAAAKPTVAKAAGSAAGQPERLQNYPPPYVPPDIGVVTCTIACDDSIPAFLITASRDNIDTVLNATKALSDSNAMLERALSSMCLKFEDAMLIHRMMLKECGDRLKVLRQLLPRMATKQDARRLINATTGGELQERLKLKTSLGARGCY